MGDHSTLNRVLVSLFNEILKIEESSLSVGEFDDLSIREIHVLEAVCRREGQTMSCIAEAIGVSPSSLTVAVNTLARKGYIERRRGDADRRIVHVFPTEQARRANELHAAYHLKMVQSITDLLSEEELRILCKSLAAVERYFHSQRGAGA